MCITFQHLIYERPQTSVFSILVGYGFDSDLKMVVKTYPFLKEPLTHLKRTVDLEKLAAKVQTYSKNSGVQNLVLKNLLFCLFKCTCICIEEKDIYGILFSHSCDREAPIFFTQCCLNKTCQSHFLKKEFIYFLYILY